MHDVVAEGKVLDEIKGCMRFACVTRSDVSGRGQVSQHDIRRSKPRCDVISMNLSVTVTDADAAHRSSRRLRRRSCRSSFLTSLRQVYN